MTLALVTRSGAVYAVRFSYVVDGRRVLGQPIVEPWGDLVRLVRAVVSSHSS